MRLAARRRSSSTACVYRWAVAISVQPMMDMTVRRSTSCNRRRVAAVWRASWSRTSRTPAAATTRFHSALSRAGSIRPPAGPGKTRSCVASQSDPDARRRLPTPARCARSSSMRGWGSTMVRLEDRVFEGECDGPASQMVAGLGDLEDAAALLDGQGLDLDVHGARWPSDQEGVGGEPASANASLKEERRTL